MVPVYTYIEEKYNDNREMQVNKKNFDFIRIKIYKQTKQKEPRSGFPTHFGWETLKWPILNGFVIC